MSIEKQDLVEIGRLLKPFGIKGDLKIKFYIDEVSDLKKLDVFYVKDKKQQSGFRMLTVSSLKFDENPESAKISFVEIPDRTSAEQWRLVPVFLPKKDLVLPTDGEYFIQDLLDLSAIYLGNQMGSVFNLITIANQEIFIIKMINSKQDLAVPFNDYYVENIDIQKQQILFKNLDELL
ncbi:MAG: ribosome maturation factor RimM [Brevinema sp.]